MWRRGGGLERVVSQPHDRDCWLWGSQLEDGAAPRLARELNL